MTLVVLGLDALDPELIDIEAHPHLVLDHWHAIETIESARGSPSTHELWPTIITGLPPQDHGIRLDQGVSWGNPILDVGSTIGEYILPRKIRRRIGNWLLNNVEVDTFRTPQTYYEANDLHTLFDGRESRAIGIPNYVTNPDEIDREHQLRKSLGDMFERDPEARGGHTSSDPHRFYEVCMEMAMVRIARVRCALRSRRYELVFGYTSGLDLIGHVTYDLPSLQERAYQELDQIVSELVDDLSPTDELLIVSDHGLQDGIHTDVAMVAGTNERLVSNIESVTDVYDAVLAELDHGEHVPDMESSMDRDRDRGAEVEQHLRDLGYL